MAESGDYAKIASIEKCPLCGEPLDRGYVAAGRGIQWAEEKSRFFLAGENLSWAILSIKYLPALRCTKCGIGIFDYGKK